MSFATLEEVAVYDDEGRVEGMQFDSRERRIQQWKEKKEDQEFDLLITKLRQHKNYRAWYTRHQDNPVFRERIKQHNQRMRAKHGKRRYAEAREQRAKEAAEKPIINVCEECGKEFVREFGYKRKRTAKFCGRSCRNRNHAKTRNRNSEGRKAEILQLVRSRYSVTAKEATASLNMSLATVRSLLNVLANEGQINKDKDEIPFRYSIW